MSDGQGPWSGRPRWWVRYDSSTDHSIRRDLDRPGGDWSGPFPTFTRARDFLTRAGAREAAALHERNKWWRETSKAEILLASRGD